MTGSTERLEIDESISFQERQWAVQRWSWTVMLVVLVFAAAGGLGPGPLSRRSVDLGSGGRLDYHRVVRSRAPFLFEFHFAHLNGPTLRLALSQTMLDALQVQRTDPQPVETQVTQQGVTYEFKVDGAGRVRFVMEALHAGKASGTVSVNAGPPHAVPLVVLP